MIGIKLFILVGVACTFAHACFTVNTNIDSNNNNQPTITSEPTTASKPTTTSEPTTISKPTKTSEPTTTSKPTTTSELTSTPATSNIFQLVKLYHLCLITFNQMSLSTSKFSGKSICLFLLFFFISDPF